MQDGEENLEIVGQYDRFNDWMFEEIADDVQGDVLEVGSGLGTISQRILHHKKTKKVVLTDISKNYVSRLKKKFTQKNVKVTSLDLGRAADFKKFKKNSFDTIVCLNVLEHVKDEVFAMENMKELLRKNGKIIILVPAYSVLYNELDKAVLHFKRYHKKDIKHLEKRVGMSVVKMFHFNFFSIFGWFLNGTVLKKGTVSTGAMGLLDTCIPLFKLFEKYILRKTIGLSLIAIFQKK